MNQPSINPSVNWESELQSESDLGYGQLFAILWRRRSWFLGVFFGVMAISVPLALSKQAVYQSDMSILAEPNYQGKSNDNQEPEFADSTVELDYSTQLKVLTSSEILKKAVDKLGLQVSEEEKLDFVESLKSLLSVYQVVAEDGTDKYGTKTKVIQVVYNGSSPEETKQILEAIKEVYLEYNLEQQEKRLINGLTFINSQIPEARKNLTKAEANLTNLSKKHNLISPEQEAIALKDNITKITQEREELKAQKNETAKTSSTLEQQLGVSSENSLALSRLSQSPRYQNLLNELQEIELNLAREKARFTEDNPIVQDLIAQRDSQKNLLIKEAEIIVGELPANFLTELEALQKQGNLVESDTKLIDTISQSQANLTGIQARENSLAQTETKLKQQLSDFPELIAEYKNLAQETEVKRAALQKLLEAKQDLEIELSRGGFNWQVIESPQLGVQVAPNLVKDLLLSTVVASFLGGATILVRETIDDTISNPQDIAKQTALPLLGTTPGLSLSSSKSFFPQLPFSLTPSSFSLQEIVKWQPFRESLDLIYENFKLSNQNSNLNSIAVTSPTPGEGKSTFVLGLALSVARRKQKVLVIDGDLRCPTLHKAFNLKNETGLANFLSGEQLKPPIEPVTLSGENIDLITSGLIPSDPVKLLSSSQLADFIRTIQNQYDLILVDTPPVIGMVDAIKIASTCDGTVLLTRLDKVTPNQLNEARSLLNRLNIVGVVANDSKEVAKSYTKKSQYILPQQV